MLADRISESGSRRPLPVANEFSAPYWQAAKSHRLVLQKCTRCDTVRYYPRPRCPECCSADVEWTEMTGRGHVYSFTEVWRALAPWFEDKLPLVCAVVELREGVRMITNIDADAADVTIGAEVEVYFDDADENISLPKFHLVDSRSSQESRA
jgi:uncharacterized OB-fold protein